MKKIFNKSVINKIVFIFFLAIAVINCKPDREEEYLIYPIYDSIINKFFSEYSIKNIKFSEQLKFEKQPTGWHVTIIDYDPIPKVTKDELFWDKKKRAFNKINFPILSDKNENQGHLSDFLNDFGKIYYSFCPYYGYDKWDIDVIEKYKNNNNLPDSILYGLGRAYSSYATNLLNNKNGLTNNTRCFNLPNGKNSMSSQQLQTYRKYSHLAIETYKRVFDINPNYQTMVGSIKQKIANEYVDAFLNLRIYQNEQEAQLELKNGIYSEFYISVAKNYLNSCAFNSILITNGDNDTYPLLYVQAKLGIRTDVLIINYSLLNFGRYVNSLRENILNSKPLTISLTPEQVNDEQRNIIWVKKNRNRMDLSELISFIKNDKNKIDNTYYLPSNRLQFYFENKLIKLDIVCQFLSRSQIVLFDLIGTTKGERPIYFATTMSNNLYLGLDNFLQLEGLAYRLVSNKKVILDESFGSVNISKLYKNMMRDFSYSDFRKIDINEKLMCSIYRNSFSRLAKAFIETNKNDSAEIVLDKCSQLISNDIVYYDFYVVSIIECYCKINKFEKANIVAKQLIYNLKNNFDYRNDIKYFNRTSLSSMESVIKRLKNIATKYDNIDLLKQLGNIENKNNN